MLHFCSMEFIEPSPAYKESFREALEEFAQANIKGFWNARETLTDIDRYIVQAKKQSQGMDLPEGWVPASTFWLIDNDMFIAHVNIRHRLSDDLRRIGGNIGYFVRPSMQKKGYGTKLLKFALLKARELGLEKILITCDKDNVGSRRVIEKNGGVFDREISVEDRPVLHFWIDLP